MQATIITVTWNETYSAQMGNLRLVSKGERTFRRQSDADKFVADLQSPEAIEFSMFAGRENKIENIQVK
jgi:hypothetical protein